MVAQPKPPRWSVEDYLEMERSSTVKHQYLDGYVYAMAGGTRRHNRLAINLITLLTTHLRGHACQVCGPDLKVRIDARNFVYPDVAVTCEPDDLDDESRAFIMSPCLVAEVLSDESTADYDRGDKFTLLYSRVQSLREYLLLDTSRVGVEVRRRGIDEAWIVSHYGPGEIVPLESVHAAFPIESFYL